MPLVAPFEEDEHPRDPGGEDGGRFIPKGTTAAGGQPDDTVQAPEVDAEEDARPATAKHLETFIEVTPYVATEGCMGWLTADGTAIDIEGEAHHRAAERLGFSMDEMFAEGNARLYAQPGEDGFLGIEITQRPTDAQIKVLVDAAQHGNFERFAIDGGGENGHRKGVIRPRDVREVINAVFGEPAKPTGIKGLPKGIEVRDDSLQRAIDRGAFDMVAKPRRSGGGFEVTITAKIPAGIATIEQRGRPVYYNPELAELATVDQGTAFERQIPQLKAGFKTEVEPLPTGNTAFGNPDRDDIPADPNFAFHATSIERAQEIAEGGKLDTHKPSYGTDQDAWPDGATEKRSYWTHDPKIARSFYPEEGKPALLRIARSQAAFKKESTGDLYLRKAVDAGALEVYAGNGEWRPLRASGGPVIYRGMSHEEYESFRETGQIKSLGDYNLAGQEGLTYWTTESDTAESYASGFAPWQYKPTFERPAYVLAARMPDAADIKNIKGTGENEVGVKRAINGDEVVGVWRGDVFMHRPGSTDLVPVDYGEKVFRTGSGSSPSSSVAWKRLK